MQKWLLAIAILSAGCQSGEPKSAAPPRAANYQPTLSVGTSTRPSVAAIAEPALPPVSIEPAGPTPGVAQTSFESIERFDVVTIPLDRVRPTGSLFSASTRSTQMPPPAARFMIRRTKRPNDTSFAVEIAQRPAGSFVMDIQSAKALSGALLDPISANAVSADIRLPEATIRRERGTDTLYIQTGSAETWVNQQRFANALKEALASVDSAL